MSAQHMPRQSFIENLRGQVLGDEAVTTLVIGEIARWTAEGKVIPEVDELTYVEFSELDKSIVANVKPDVVLSPLVTDSFDAFQVMRYLESSDFRGRYRAVSSRLPNLPMIRKEITSAAPQIDFDIIVMPPNLVSV